MCSLLDPLQRNHALLELHETPHDEQQVVRNGRSERERETGLRSGDRWREKDYYSCEAQDDSGEDIKPRRKPSVDRPIDQRWQLVWNTSHSPRPVKREQVGVAQLHHLLEGDGACAESSNHGHTRHGLAEE